MKVTTTEPGFQFYCAGFLDGTNIGRGGKVRVAICLSCEGLLFYRSVLSVFEGNI